MLLERTKKLSDTKQHIQPSAKRTLRWERERERGKVWVGRKGKKVFLIVSRCCRMVKVDDIVVGAMRARENWKWKISNTRTFFLAIRIHIERENHPFFREKNPRKIASTHQHTFMRRDRIVSLFPLAFSTIIWFTRIICDVTSWEKRNFPFLSQS